MVDRGDTSNTKMSKICIICKKEIPKSQLIGKNKDRRKVCEGECKKINSKKVNTNWSAKKRGTGLDKNEVGDVMFGNMKEPLMPAPSGSYGYLGVILYNKSKDKIQCHVCGKFYRALSGSGHLKLHEMSNDEYKEKFEIDRTVALCAEGTREKHLNALLMREDYQDGTVLKKLNKYTKSKNANEQRKKTNLGKKRRIYAKNKTGHCPEQLLDKIKQLHAKLGYVPNGEDFKREHTGKYISSIIQTFGSYNKAIEKCGFEIPDKFRNSYKRDDLINYLKDFYKRFGRTASNTDFKRGYLPSIKVYIRVFGSLNNARIEAGVPVTINLGYGRWSEVKINNKQ